MTMKALTAAQGLAVALGLTLSAGAAQAQSLNLTLSGGNPGGLWSLLGAGMDRAVKANDKDAVITYQATGGGFANIGLLAANRTDLGMVHDAEVKLALSGQEPFKAPVTNMQAIGYMYNWAPMHFFLNKSIAEEHGIDSLDDLATSGAPLTIGINRSGNITGNVALFMLEAAGLDEATLTANGGSFVRAGANEQGDLMQDGRIDMATNGIFIGHSSFRAIDENTDVVLLAIPEEVIAATNEEFGTSPYTVPGGSYANQPDDVATMALGAMVVATDDDGRGGGRDPRARLSREHRRNPRRARRDEAAHARAHGQPDRASLPPGRGQGLQESGPHRVIASLVATGRRRTFTGAPARILTILAAAFACWVIYANLFVISDPLVLGILFVSGILTLLFPVIGHSPHAGDTPTPVDWALSALSLAAGIFFFVNAQVISDRITLLDAFTGPQFFFGTAILLLTLEATRRTTGAGLTGVVVLFLLYNWFGYLLPPPFGHGISDFSYLLDILIFTTDGVFGVPVQVVASYVFLFVMFGTLLSKAGGGEFFFHLASAVTGNSRGGPAKVAVISSGLYGTMSGSPTSDVVATGSITIPIMKRLGYSKRFSGAVEVAASTGGSAMPPIMGSAAFILAEYTGTPYREIVYAALIPALLYYVGVFLQVHLRAVCHDLRSYNGDIPKLSATFTSGWPFLIPIAIIIGVLMAGYSPVLTAGAGSLAVVVGTLLSARTRMTLWQIVEALGETTLRILPVAGACAAAGLVIGGLSMTGLGMKAANVIIQVSGGTVAMTLLLGAVVTILLGLGMPTPSAYILAAVLVGPALTKIGLPILESHMFLLYYAILSALTPPIAVAALAAAAIADEDPFIIAFDAVRLAAVGFLMPFVFIWNPAILGQGAGFEIALVVLGGLVGATAIALSFEWIGARTSSTSSWPVRGLLLLGAAAAVAPITPISIAGIAATGGLIAILLAQARNVKTKGDADTVKVAD